MGGQFGRSAHFLSKVKGTPSTTLSRGLDNLTDETAALPSKGYMASPSFRAGKLLELQP
jgi:hypothetical protein